MNQDDSFASSDTESDKTIIMPTPGRRSGSSGNHSTLADTGQQGFDAPLLSGRIDIASTRAGLNPLVAEANTLLNIVPQFRTTLQHSDLPGLRDLLVQLVKKFESGVKEIGIVSDKVVIARYALCTLLDETIASTPWGSSEWSQYSLLVTFHNEASGGEKFFQILAKLKENPKANYDLLELMYICLTLGLEGRYRLLENGKAQLDGLREQLAQLLKKERGEYERDLSPQWEASVFKQDKVFKLVPLWVWSALCGLILLIAYLSFNSVLNGLSDSVFSQIRSIQIKNPVIRREPIGTRSSPSLVQHISQFLAREIQADQVFVHDENGRCIITLLGDGLFASGRAVASKEYDGVLRRIADALNSVSGQIHIVGHTDNRAIRSIRFPSNWHLSQERADSMMKLFTEMGVQAIRLRAEGVADAKPVASNNTSEGRARNRRVEIVLFGSPAVH